MRVFLLALSLILLTGNRISAEEGLRITEMAVTTKIVRGNPIDAVRRISSTSVKTLYCFTRITAPGDEETKVVHAWFHNDKLVKESELPVKGKHWRTYSKRLIDKDSVGEWRVEARDGNGKLLKDVTFRIN